MEKQGKERDTKTIKPKFYKRTFRTQLIPFIVDCVVLDISFSVESNQKLPTFHDNQIVGVLLFLPGRLPRLAVRAVHSAD